MTNEELAKEIQKGRNALIETLWGQCYGFIRQQATRWGRAWENRKDFDTEDLIQSGYFAICSAVEGFTPDRGAFITYLSFCLKTEFAKVVGCQTEAQRQEPIYRSARFDDPVGGDSDGLTVGDTIGAECAELEAAEERIYQEQLSSLVIEAVDKLPAQQRIAIKKHYLHGWSFSAVAEELKVSGSRVGQIVNDGLKAIRNSSSANTLLAVLYSDLDCYRGTGKAAYKATGKSVQEQILIAKDSRKEMLYRLIREGRFKQLEYWLEQYGMTREDVQHLFSA